MRSLAVDPNDPSVVYVGLWAPGLENREEYIYRPRDFGTTWEDIRLNLASLRTRVWGLHVDPATGEPHISTDHGNYVLR